MSRITTVDSDGKSVTTGKAPDEKKVIDLGSLSTFELIQIVAGIVENEKGTHSPKHYRMLANDMRALAQRL